jgi:CDP-glycerol glycerophosphotransferase
MKDRIYKTLNKVSPKFNQVLVKGSNTIENNAIEVANYISLKKQVPVYFAVNPPYMAHARKLLLPKIKLISYYSFRYWRIYFTSKYIFSSHGNFLEERTKNQVAVNIWHGVGHKRIGLLRDTVGIYADLTVATSDLTRKYFSDSFGVPPERVFVSGYPRNDSMLRAKKYAVKLKKQLTPDLSAYKKVIIWMPTFRRERTGKIVRKGLEEGNPFQIEGFDDMAFDQLLKKHQTLCIIKPHKNSNIDQINKPMPAKHTQVGPNGKKYSNLVEIDDHWIGDQGISLYQLIACTDILVTDFSSVMMDYILMDQPVVCFSTDLEEYKNTQGLYFEDIENWLPTKLVQNQEDFFRLLTQLLTKGEDPYQEKRKEIRDLFFTYKDANSTERLVEHVFRNFKTIKTS